MSIRYLIVGWEAQARSWVLHHLSAAYPYADLRTMTIADFERQRASINRRNTDIVVLCAAFGATPDERKSEGITALKKVAQQPAFPAIVVVADGGSEFTAVRSLRLGALDYLPRRHLSGERLLETIEKTIRFVQDRQRRGDEVVRASPTPSATADAASGPEPKSVSAMAGEAESRAPLIADRIADAMADATADATADAQAQAPAKDSRDPAEPAQASQWNEAAPDPVMLAAAEPAPEPAADGESLVSADKPQAVPETLGPVATAELLEGSGAADHLESARPPAPSETAPPDGEADAPPMIDMAEVFADPSPSQVQSQAASGKARALLSIAPRAKRAEPWPEVPGYIVLQRIAESDHAHVLLARQGKRRDRVALKISKIARGSATGARGVASASLEREFETLSTLSHRSVVEMYDFGSIDGFDYLAMEYFPCGDLRRRLQNPLTEDEIVDYMRQVARALEFVHRVGLVHGDLKPQNVMLRADNSVALIDFGLVSDHKRDSGTDQTGLVCGSPYYMSPEQTRSLRLDARSDLYSLGVMLFEMLTGKRPFVAKSIPEIIDLHRNALPAPLPAEHARFQPIVDKLLAKEPEARFNDASQLLLALDSFGGARSAVIAESS